MDPKNNPYTAKSGTPSLKKSIVAFVDILGYLEMAAEAEASDQENELLNKLHKAIKEHRGWLEGRHALRRLNGKHGYAVKAFTDNIVIGWPINSADSLIELASAFQKLQIFQLYMVLSGFFIRGGISIGNAYIDDIAVFGGGVNEAYKVESTTARDPRIALSPLAAETVRHHAHYFKTPIGMPTQVHDILIDVDGQCFVNYLDCIMIALEEQGPFFKELSIHKEMVENNLAKYKANPRIWRKYAWTANYHNYFCDLYKGYVGPEYRIDWEKFPAYPTPVK